MEGILKDPMLSMDTFQTNFLSREDTDRNLDLTTQEL